MQLARKLGLSILLLFLGACAGQTAPPGTYDPVPPVSGALPAPHDLLNREPMDSFGLIQGSEYTDTLPRNRANGSAATVRFTPADGPPYAFLRSAYCVYRTPVAGDSGALVWTPCWATAPAEGLAWVGLANLTLNRWDWKPLGATNSSVQFDGSEDYLAPDGSVLLAVLLWVGAGESDLDYFSIERKPQSGWKFVEIYSENRPAIGYIYASPAQFAGKTALVMQEFGQDSLYDVTVMLSTTTTGLSPGDWTSYPLWTDGPALAGLTDLDGGYAMACVLDDVSENLDELHYRYGTDLSQPLTDELVSTEVSITSPHLAVIGGMPAIAFGQTAVDATSSHYVWYASSDAVSGGNWTAGQVSDTDYVSNAVSSTVTQPLEIGGVPAIGYYSLKGVDSQFTVAVADTASPATSSDWTPVYLGPGSDNSMSAFMYQGKPTFCATHFVVPFPNEVEFWTYQLTGSDASSPADWSIVHYDGLGLGQYGPGSLGPIGNGLAFLRRAPSAGSSFLNGYVEPLEFWHSDAPGNTAADWEVEIFDPDREYNSAASLLEINAQPAICQAVWIDAGYGAEERYLFRVIWSLYVP